MKIRPHRRQGAVRAARSRELREAFARGARVGHVHLRPRTSRRSRRRPPTYLGVPDAIGVANGTDAIVLVLDAMGIGPERRGDLPAFTFYATAEAIARVGATPVFADIDPVTLNLDPEDVERRITPRTKAIMPVHLFGRPAPLAELAALRPAAASRTPPRRSARRRSRAPASPRPSASSRRRTCSGSATAASSRATDEALAERIRMLRFHGSKAKKTFELIGYNSRLDEMQAAALRIFLPRARRLERRAARGGGALRRARPRRARRAARRRARATSTTCTSAARPSATASAPRSRRREIGNAAYYLPPLHLQPALRYLGYERGLAAGDGAGGRGELLAAALGGDRPPSSRSASSRPSATPSASPPTREKSRSTGIGCRSWRRTSRSSSQPGSSPSGSASTPTCPVYYERYVTLGGPRARRRRSSSRSSPSSASTTAGGATSRRATCGARRAASRRRRSSPSSSSASSRSTRADVPRTVWVIDWPADARARRRLAHARAHDHRAPAEPLDRRPRQGGDRRRRRRRRPADAARDAAHARRSATRRSA